ncbi:MAG: GntR family transcriptional regulator [Janthinobacterium lividum]
MESKRPQTARQYVVSVLRTEILRGTHDAGARLRQEEVAARLGVSTTPVREAFRDLLAEGLIGLDTHRGVLVRGLTLADVRELYQLRILLEPRLVVSTLASALPGHLAAAEATHLRLCAEQDPERWAALNVVFHRELTLSVPEGRLARIVANLAEAAGAYVTLSMHASPELMAFNNADHTELLQHYRNGDAEAAARKTAEHLEQTLRAIEENVQARLVGSQPVV